jgi:hypothetical protein
MGVRQEKPTFHCEICMISIPEMTKRSKEKSAKKEPPLHPVTAPTKGKYSFEA